MSKPFFSLSLRYVKCVIERHSLWRTKSYVCHIIPSHCTHGGCDENCKYHVQHLIQHDEYYTHTHRTVRIVLCFFSGIDQKQEKI